MLSIIAAIGRNRELGKDNRLLWHIPEDFKRFKELTLGHPIIMGRKTFESIGRVLPNRTNIIITRDKNYKVEGAIVCGSLEEAIEKAEESIKYSVSSIKNKNKTLNTKYNILNTDEDEIFIIGGGQIFEQALPLADKLYLTIIDPPAGGGFDADTFFPDYSEFKKVIFKQKGQSQQYKYTFLDLKK